MSFPYPSVVTQRNEEPDTRQPKDVSGQGPAITGDNRRQIGDKSAITGDKPATTGEKLDIEKDNYNKIIQYLDMHDFITNSIAMDVLELKSSQTRRIMGEMVEIEILEARGAKRNRSYVLKSTSTI